jgi:hypothetical protein
VNATAAELGTTWPSLRKAFARHGLGIPARNPEAVRQRTLAAASSSGSRAPSVPTDPTSSPRRGRWLPMPADPIHPDQLDGEQRFRADLAAYLDSLPVGELAELLGELPCSRQEPLGLGVLMVALNERLPDAFKLLPPAGHPGPGEGRRRTLRQVVADRRAARAAQHAGPSASGLAERLTDHQQQADLNAERARAARWASGGWPRQCAAGPPTPIRRPAATSTVSRRPSGSVTSRSRSRTASPRTTSATPGGPTGSAPTTSARLARPDRARSARADKRGRDGREREAS